MRIGAVPRGGASVAYWQEIAERHSLNLTVVNPQVDPRWAFMPLDTDGKIRMDCSSPHAMATLETTMRPASGDGVVPYAVATGDEAGGDRDGIVTPDAGLMNPNQCLAVARD